MPKKGYKQTLEHRRKAATAHLGLLSGIKHPMWKGGRTKANGEGYMMLWMPHHPSCDKRGYILEHRYLMEQKLGRYLNSSEEVDHINGIKDDNRLDNLKLFNSHTEHIKEETRRGKYYKTPSWRKNLSEANKVAYLKRLRDAFGRFI